MKTTNRYDFVQTIGRAEMAIDVYWCKTNRKYGGTLRARGNVDAPAPLSDAFRFSSVDQVITHYFGA